jgi:hypothetical protein
MEKRSVHSVHSVHSVIASIASIVSIAMPMIMCLSVLDMVWVQVVPFQYPISDSLSLTFGCVGV